MTDETIQRSLEAVVLADGRGEIRDGGEAIPLRAESPDELRALVITRTVELARAAGGPLRLLVLESDGAFPLIVFTDGDINEESGPAPVEPARLTLWSEGGNREPAPRGGNPTPHRGEAAHTGQHAAPRPAPARPVLPPLHAPRGESDTRPARVPVPAGPGGSAGHLAHAGHGAPAAPPRPAPAPARPPGAETAHDGGYAAEFGDGAPKQQSEVREVHATIALPRPGMMRDEAFFEQELDELESVQTQAAGTQTAAARQDVSGSREGGKRAAGAVPVTDDRGTTAEERAQTTENPTPPARPAVPPSPQLPAAAQTPAVQPAPVPQAPTAAPAPQQAAAQQSGQPLPAQAPAASRTPDAPAAASQAEPHGAGGQEGWVPAFPRERREAPAQPVVRQAQPVQPAARPPAAHYSGTSRTVEDLRADKPNRPASLAEDGWRGSLRRSSGGLIKLRPSVREQIKRDEVSAIRRSFTGHRSIVVMNPKGGAHKTTATLMIAATFGMYRGGYTLAWDNNETRGTLGWRSHPGDHDRTAVDLLHQLSHFEISGGATISDVDRFVRHQGSANFDVLASDDDAASAAIIDDEAFSRLFRTLSRFYRVIVIDTGNNMRASNWEAALEIADQLVIVSTAREDTAASAAWLADGLAERGFGDKLANAVTVLSSPSAKEDRNLQQRLREHFSQITRDVVEVPYDHEFVGGGELDIASLRSETRDAWRRAAAVIARGL